MKAFTVKLLTIALGFTLTSAHAQTVTLQLAVSAGDFIDGYELAPFSIGGATDGMRPGINDSGTLSFWCETANAQNGFFTQTTKLAHSEDAIDGFALIRPVGGLGSINENGVSVFNWAYGENGETSDRGAFTQNNVLAATGDTIDGRTIRTVAGSPVVNDSGTVVFYGFTSPGEGIFTQYGLLVKNGDTIGGKQLDQFANYPSINNSGTIAFRSTFSGGTGIFTQTQSLVSTGETFAGETVRTLGDPVLNNNGQVVTYARIGAGFSRRDAILSINDRWVARVGDVIAGQTMTALGKWPTINDSGLVAYTGTFAGGSGIFANDLLIARTGDILAGRTFASFSNPGINDLNSIAFVATFTDGSSGVVVADITPVPELLLGDMDGDGDVDNFDIQPFELALTDRATYEATYSLFDADERGDIDGDGDLDNFDIQPFEQLLTAGPVMGTSAVPEPSSMFLLIVDSAGLVIAYHCAQCREFPSRRGT